MISVKLRKIFSLRSKIIINCFLSKAKKASITFHFTLYTFHFGLPIVASVLGDNFLDGGDGALDHRIVGLFGGDVLEPYAGGGD